MPDLFGINLIKLIKIFRNFLEYIFSSFFRTRYWKISTILHQISSIAFCLQGVELLCISCDQYHYILFQYFHFNYLCFLFFIIISKIIRDSWRNHFEEPFVIHFIHTLAIASVVEIHANYLLDLYFQKPQTISKVNYCNVQSYSELSALQTFLIKFVFFLHFIFPMRLRICTMLLVFHAISIFHTLLNILVYVQLSVSI